MAKLKAYQAFDQANFDMSLSIRDHFDSDFWNDVDAKYQGVRYEDVLIADYSAQGSFYATVFAGKGTTWTSNYLKATGGTVQLIGELVWNGSSHDWMYALQGLSLRATDVVDAMYSPQQSDDFLLLRAALSGADHMVMSRFDDSVSGFNGADVIDGKGGHDFLNGHTGNDRLLGRAGNDELYGGGGSDTLLGGGGSDELFGGKGQDKLFGHAGHDVLLGQGGADQINGGSGRDVVEGGRGNDILRGGGGKDVFVFRKGDGSDTIRDFNARTDLIEIERGASDFSHLSLNQIGSDVLVEFSNVSILLEDLSVRELTSENFLF